jgi:putative transposase
VPAQPKIPLPDGWRTCVKSAVLQVISLARFSMAYTRGWAADSINSRMRLNAENERLREEINLLREEVRIKDARMKRIPAPRRPHYLPTERMGILELRAARGWSLVQTARVFLLTADTVSAWMKRIDEQGPEALVQLREPVNKFPEFVRYLVQRLKLSCPNMGKVRIANTLCRVGLQLSAPTVGRMLKEPPRRSPVEQRKSTGRVVTAKRPNHVWHVDLTVVPTSAGFWTTWFPLAVPQCWPFCWWVAVVIDHYSRRVMGCTLFPKCPTSQQVRTFLGRTMHVSGARPKYLICDKGKQFIAEGFQAWSRRKKIRVRYGAVGRRGSIAVIERFWLSLKQECVRVVLVALRREEARREIVYFIDWFNQHRPHMALEGRTPEEVYRGPPLESGPNAIEPSEAGRPLELSLRFHAGRRHLPIVTLKRAA